MLKGKKIIIGISGSIAAYKIPILVRLLVREGAEVKVVMTPEATKFVSPLSLATVSKHEVLIEISQDNQWADHVGLGYWADLIAIMPASANTLAHLANGFCNNLLHAIYLSAKCPVMIAPAMDADMWEHPSVKHNVATLERYGHKIIPVAHGELASGLIGYGRMPETAELLDYIIQFHTDREHDKDISRPKAIITAGPTHEMIDPVRFIGNMSSGKMGIALANALANRNWDVTLITGPGVDTSIVSSSIHIEKIISADDLLATVSSHFPDATMVIMAAAVADFRPAVKHVEKIKKVDGSDNMEIQLVKNPDILAHLGKHKNENQIIVGFALETNNELDNAKSKLVKKNADFIALNSLQHPDVGFGKDTTAITLLSSDGSTYDLGADTKDKIAAKMIDTILNNLPTK